MAVALRTAELVDKRLYVGLGLLQDGQSFFGELVRVRVPGCPRGCT